MDETQKILDELVEQHAKDTLRRLRLAVERVEVAIEAEARNTLAAFVVEELADLQKEAQPALIVRAAAEAEKYAADRARGPRLPTVEDRVRITVRPFPDRDPISFDGTVVEVRRSGPVVGRPARRFHVAVDEGNPSVWARTGWYSSSQMQALAP